MGATLPFTIFPDVQANRFYCGDYGTAINEKEPKQ